MRNTFFRNNKVSILLLFLITFLGGTKPAVAQEEAGLLPTAAEAYSNQDYEKAIDQYEQLLANGKDAFEVYYNLGNAYFKADNIAAAILNYERAARINPSDPDLQYNLATAQSRTADKIEVISIPEFVSGYKSFINAVSADQWGINSFIVFFLMLASLLGFLFSNKIFVKRILLFSTFVFLFLTLVFFYFGWQQRHWLSSNKEAIIFQPSITVASTPDPAGEDLFVLHEGTKVHIVERFRGWIRIRIGNGNTGWVLKEVVKEI